MGPKARNPIAYFWPHHLWDEHSWTNDSKNDYENYRFQIHWEKLKQCLRKHLKLFGGFKKSAEIILALLQKEKGPVLRDYYFFQEISKILSFAYFSL